MAKLINFNLSKSEYLDLAEKASADGDSEKCIVNVRKALEQDDKFVDAYILLGKEYSFLGLQELSNRFLFKALSLRPDEEQTLDIYQMLASNLLEMSEKDSAEYHLQTLADFYDVDFSFDDFVSQSKPEQKGFRIVYPKSEDYYESLIKKAYALMRERRFDDAIALVDEIDEKSKFKETADGIVIACLMIKQDVDAAIANAKKILERKPDSVMAKSTLVGAYLLEDKDAEAQTLLDEILENDLTDMEDVFRVLPLLVSLNRHVDVVKYTKRTLESVHAQLDTMMWLSQGLYNIGAKEEAKKTMHKVLNIYGDFSAAQYFLDLYDENPESVEYSLGYPQEEKMRRYKQLHEYMLLDPIALALLLDTASEDDDPLKDKKEECKKLFEWAFLEGNPQIENVAIDVLDQAKTRWGVHFMKELLITPNLQFEVLTHIMHTLFIKRKQKFFVVARHIFKEIDFELPRAFFSLPSVWHRAVEQTAFDIIYNDVEPNVYLERLKNLVDSIVKVDGEENPIFDNPKLAKLKSENTLVGVFLCKIYEDDDEDPRPDTIESYEIKQRTFDKYWKLIFGEDDGNRKD
ncbi:MAG: hypothetical protein J5713_03965 [Clostridia bacterium]|nr:hypothetical protein [Clostridia bacterium]